VPRQGAGSPAVPMRNTAIAVLFLAGGAILYFSAIPSSNRCWPSPRPMGVPTFVFGSGCPPSLSDFPEEAEVPLLGAESVERNTALMNIGGWGGGFPGFSPKNINQ